MLTGFVLTALISFSASAVEAQTGQIVGQVTDAGSSAPLSEVQVYLPDSEIGVLSRQDGRFIILNVPAGTYELAAERIGYASVSQQVTVTAGGSSPGFLLDDVPSIGSRRDRGDRDRRSIEASGGWKLSSTD